MFRLNRKTMTALALAAIVVYVLMYCNGKNTIMQYEKEPTAKKKAGPAPAEAAVTGAAADAAAMAPAGLEGTKIDLNMGCAMNSGVGLASSLLPREMASQEDFGQFAPSDILKGQNFLSPRQQVGWPETVGGTLRNANQQIRADPPNPKDPYTWNNSTIVPDLMQRKICT